MLNMPRAHNDYFTYQFLLFFLLGFIINVYSNGQATLYYLDKEYSINSTQQTLIEDAHLKELKETYQHLSYQKGWVNLATLILYFGVSPLVNFYFAFFKFKKGQWKVYSQKAKDLNTLAVLKGEGN